MLYEFNKIRYNYENKLCHSIYRQKKNRVVNWTFLRLRLSNFILNRYRNLLRASFCQFCQR